MFGDQFGRRGGEELAVALRGQDQARRDLGDALRNAKGPLGCAISWSQNRVKID